VSQASRVPSLPAEAVLGSIAALTNDGILTIGRGGAALDLNRAGASMLGWRRTNPVRGRSIDRVFARANLRDERGGQLSGHELLLRAAASTGGYQVGLSPPPGTGTRWVRVSISRAARGISVMLLRDVTPLIATQNFLGALSHELRTPVTTILGGTKVLRRLEHLPAETRRELYADIEAESERLYRLVEDMMMLARFEHSHGNGVANEPLLLQRVLPELVAAEQAGWPGREFVLRVPPDLMTVRADRTYVDQVVRNLLGNAAKYSRAGSPIEIEAKSAGGEVTVRVLDRGPGFPPEEAELLFEPYYRSPEVVGVAIGAGIGLSVCRRLVEAMGGRIWARPRDGGGSEFGFALHILDEEEG
jgi:signal transduction histidine kinase